MEIMCRSSGRTRASSKKSSSRFFEESVPRGEAAKHLERPNCYCFQSSLLDKQSSATFFTRSAKWCHGHLARTLVDVHSQEPSIKGMDQQRRKRASGAD